jgi:serine/threonine protein kinase SCH9
MALANGLQFREDNENDDSDIPRSGVATPQPDPSDKRLPSIMHNYFGQVGSASSTRQNSGLLENPVMGSDVSTPARRDEVLPKVTPGSNNEPASDSQEAEAEAETPLPLAPPEKFRSNGLHPYPTPPVSQPPSLHKLKLSNSSSSEDEEVRATESATSCSAHHKSISESIPSRARRASSMIPLSSVLTASNVHAAHFSNPSDCTTTPSTPSHSRLNSEFHESPSYDRLKRLTDDVKKSIPATPTRALSNQTNKSDTSGGSDHANAQNGKDTKLTTAELAPSQTALPSTGAPAPAPKGKLTVKIAEARGLRKSRDPYVVAVFQRNELVSKGPLPGKEDEEEQGTTSSPMGGIPIMRSGSDSGRPMAIPMKSRQSSNTSLSDYRDFKIKGRRSMTNPKWDTEAVL